MTDTTSLDPPSTPVLMGLYRDLSSVLDQIAGASSSDLDDASVCELARMNEKAVRALGFQGLQRLLEVSDRGAFRKAGHPTLHRFVMSELRVTRGDATSRLKALDAVARFHSLQGEVLPPKCPAAAEALAEGAIGLAHMDVMLDVRKHIPNKAAPEVLDVVDAWMVDNARTMNPTDLIQCGREVLARVDPDGTLTDEQDRKRNRGLSVGEQGADLMAKITGTLDPQTLALFKTVLDVWAAPGMNNPDDPDSPVGAVDDPGHHKALIESAAHRDTRTTAQRQHDAFKAILRTVLRYKISGHVPSWVAGPGDHHDDKAATRRRGGHRNHRVGGGSPSQRRSRTRRSLRQVVGCIRTSLGRSPVLRTGETRCPARSAVGVVRRLPWLFAPGLSPTSHLGRDPSRERMDSGRPHQCR